MAAVVKARVTLAGVAVLNHFDILSLSLFSSQQGE